MNTTTPRPTPETDTFIRANARFGPNDAMPPAGLAPVPIRPACDNCGDPATYRAYHFEGGGVHVCESCMRYHGRDHSQVRKVWPPASLRGDINSRSSFRECKPNEKLSDSRFKQPTT